MATAVSAETVARGLVDAFTAADLARLRSFLADDVRACITNARGGVDEIRGADDYVRRVEAMDLPSARFRIAITQLVTVRPDLVMLMVEVNAARGGRTLHNHAAHLLTVRGGIVSEWWMVEALPSESDAFWSQ
jgi:ketosteroid isomerase-like protein